jgi:6,7-dimethyl-8-ribityllumazine synthase
MAKGTKILVVVAEFNELITKCLLAGAEQSFADAKLVAGKDYEVVWVPGCFELPVVANKAAQSGQYKAIVTLGAVIRGETPHFDFVAGEAARGVMDVALKTNVPVIFGVLTTNTVEQALNRSGIKYGNKGRDAAAAALKMIKTMEQI